MDSFQKDAALIVVYTRKQALEDGVLIDISETAREAGFRCPVAVTEGVFGVLNPTTELKTLGQDLQGRLWDLLNVLLLQIRRIPAGSDIVKFAPLFVQDSGGNPQPVKMWAKAGPGDDMELVITVMLEGED